MPGRSLENDGNGELGRPTGAAAAATSQLKVEEPFFFFFFYLLRQGKRRWADVVCRCPADPSVWVSQPPY